LSSARERATLSNVTQPTHVTHPAAAALRDTLGLVRVLYAATTDGSRRAALAQAGHHLSTALELSPKPPGTLGFRAVPLNTEQGFAALSKVAWSPEIARMVEAARARVQSGLARADELETRAARSQQH
jgi:hypothetical protein